MQSKTPSTINIALVGVGDGKLCIELLEKTTFNFQQSNVNARVVAVADPDRDSPGMVFARKLNLFAVTDYHELYAPEHDIHLIIILVPNEHILNDILDTHPSNIRILSYHVFDLFWKAIAREENKLRERNLEVETIFNGIQDFILVITPDREIVDVNEAFLSKMHFPRNEVIGKKCHEIFQNGNPPCLIGSDGCPLNEVIRNERPAIHILKRVNKRGDLRYIEVTVYPLWEKNGKINKFIEISRDITDRKKEEEETTRRLEQMVEQRTRELKETHNKLIHQDKMASLGKLSASVVHEINNPIAGILNLILLIKRIKKEEGIGSAEVGLFSKYLNLMETETRRIGRIVSNLLAFSKQAKIEMERIDLYRLVEKILILNLNLLKINNIKVEKHFSQNLPEITGSKDQLQQVFMNIISNSVEAMESSGEGVLRIEAAPAKSGDDIVIAFKDTGVGIAKTLFPKLFEPFFTTKKKSKGVGLGLSVAYGIVEEHGGSIRVESEKGKGTSFEIELPVKQKSEI